MSYSRLIRPLVSKDTDPRPSLELVGGSAASRNRRCKKCGLMKANAEFQQRKGERSHKCKECRNAERRELHQLYPGKVREYLKRRRNDLRVCLASTIRTKRYTAKKARIAFSITTDDLLALFKQQDGRCALTGRDLVWGADGVQENTLSIDRVYHDQGYVPHNIRLVINQSNMARGNLSDAQLFRLCEDILRARDEREAS